MTTTSFTLKNLECCLNVIDLMKGEDDEKLRDLRDCLLLMRDTERVSVNRAEIAIDIFCLDRILDMSEGRLLLCELNALVNNAALDEEAR